MGFASHKHKLYSSTKHHSASLAKGSTGCKDQVKRSAHKDTNPDHFMLNFAPTTSTPHLYIYSVVPDPAEGSEGPAQQQSGPSHPTDGTGGAAMGLREGAHTSAILFEGTKCWKKYDLLRPKKNRTVKLSFISSELASVWPDNDPIKFLTPQCLRPILQTMPPCGLSVETSSRFPGQIHWPELGRLKLP